MTTYRMTERDRATYKAIKAYCEQHGMSPTLRELGDILEISSSSTVYTRVRRLWAMGLVTFNPKSGRSLRIVACPVFPGEVA